MNDTPSILATGLSALRPAAPLTSGGLTVLPFTTTYRGGRRYVLLDQAIERGRLVVTEVSAEGAVPYLKAVNKGPWPVLIFDGEELVGAKQNRIANTTILIGVGESILPVSCVEQGRWSLRTQAFASGAYASHPGLRLKKHLKVTASLRSATEQAASRRATAAAQGVGDRPQVQRASLYCADQGDVWNEVANRSRRAGVRSETAAMADAYAGRSADLDRAMQAFLRPPDPDGSRAGGVPVEGMVAAAMFLGGRFVCFDALWPAKRFARLYPKLLRGYLFEALASETAAPSTPSDPEAEMLRIFARLADARPVEHRGVDLGLDIRFETDSAVGAGLVWDESLVQLSLFPR